MWISNCYISFTFIREIGTDEQVPLISGDTTCPASNPIVLHIAGVTGSSPCSVTLYAPGSSSTFVPVDEPGKLFCDGLLPSITTVKFEG